MHPRRGPRSFRRSAIALAVALAVFASFVLGGQRYFYCGQMHEASFEACCGDHSSGATDDEPSIDREACCRAERFLSLSPGVTSHHAEALRAPLTAVLPVATPPRAGPPAPSFERGRLARAGPGEPGPREHRLRLMVFLT